MATRQHQQPVERPDLNDDTCHCTRKALKEERARILEALAFYSKPTSGDMINIILGVR